MHKVMLDTNILLDYFGIGCTESQQRATSELIGALHASGNGFLFTSTSLKDFVYIFQSCFKRQVQQEKGKVSNKDAEAIKEIALDAVDALTDLGSIASEGINDCRMARILCKSHNNYEDNLIAAVAMRIEADMIVTRNRAFSKHCPVACFEPKDALAFLKAVDENF